VSLKIVDTSKPSAPSISAPATAAKYSTIIAILKNGDAPAAGQTVTVYTPDGIMNAKSDEDGRVAVNAAGDGTYTFSWSGQASKTTVGTPAVASPKGESRPPVQTPPTEAEILTPPAASSPVQGMANKDVANAAMGGTLLLIALFAVAAVVGGVLFFALRKARGESPHKPDSGAPHDETAEAKEGAQAHQKHAKEHHMNKHKR